MTSVKYGDTVFVLFPRVQKGMLVTGTNNLLGHQIIKIEPGTITDGDAYVIEPIGDFKIGDDLKSMEHFKLISAVNNNKKWADVVHNVIVTDIESEVTSDDTWYAQLPNLSTGTIYYGSEFRLHNAGKAGYVSYVNGEGFITSNADNDSVISFAPGIISNAKLECCRENISQVYCGNYYGYKCNSNCDDILTNYCNNVSTADPKCGCLLPSNLYDLSKQVAPPECIDNRCINKDTYRTSTQCGGNCPVANCSVPIDYLNNPESHIDKQTFYSLCPTAPIEFITPTTEANRERDVVLAVLGGVVLALAITTFIVLLIYLNKRAK